MLFIMINKHLLLAFKPKILLNQTSLECLFFQTPMLHRQKVVFDVFYRMAKNVSKVIQRCGEEACETFAIECVSYLSF